MEIPLLLSVILLIFFFFSFSFLIFSSLGDEAEPPTSKPNLQSTPLRINSPNPVTGIIPAIAAPSPVPETTPTQHEPMDTTPALELTPVEVKVSKGRVGVVVSGNQGEADHLVETISKALGHIGVTSTVVSRAPSLIALPIFVQQIARNVDVVIVASYVHNDEATSQTIRNALLQYGMGNMGNYTPIIPAIINEDSLLKAKAMAAVHSTEWAKAALDLLNIKNGVTTIEITDGPIVEPPPVLTPELNDVQKLLQILRESLKQHGARGIVGLGRKFKIADDDRSGCLCLPEFTKVINEHKLNWTQEQISLVFSYFDNDGSKSISYDEFVVAVRGELNDRRKQLVLLAFSILDKDKSGIVDYNDVIGVYDATKHPDVISGKKTEKDILAEFLDTFDSIDKDGKVTPDEFIKYYSNVSSSIDDDDYFELMIRNAWHISGGEGWCANSSCRRVLVTHKDGRQTVEEIKNDLGIKDDDFEAMLKKLQEQGLDDIVTIETNSGNKRQVEDGAIKHAPAAPTNSNGVKPPTPPEIFTRTQGFNPKRQPGGASSLVLG